MAVESAGVDYSILNYHRHLLSWHTRHFYPFRRRLTSLEKDYLETCFRLAQSFAETSEDGYEHFSYYTYSHRVDGDQVNSSRMAYGSVTHPEEAFAAAAPVLAERGIAVPDEYGPDFRFYGLGWDLQEGQFKLYLRARDLTLLPPHLKELVAGYDLSAHRAEGLISYTYEGSQLAEKKVYLYPLDDKPEVAGVLGQARMVTSKRGEVPQYDLEEGADWSSKLNAAGQTILRKYRQLGEPLDTIAYQDPDHFTLYFP